MTRSTVTPGTVLSTAHGSFDCGVLCSSPWVSVVSVPIFLTSTTGVSAVTVTVSSSDFTAIGNVSVALTPVVTITSRSILLKPLRFVDDLIGAGIQVEEAELTLGIGDGRSRLTADRDRCERHVHARQDAAALIGHGPVDVAAGNLRVGAGRERGRREARASDRALVSFGAPSL